MKEKEIVKIFDSKHPERPEECIPLAVIYYKVEKLTGGGTNGVLNMRFSNKLKNERFLLEEVIKYFNRTFQSL